MQTEKAYLTKTGTHFDMVHNSLNTMEFICIYHDVSLL